MSDRHHSYADGPALRAALEHRLNERHRQTSLPVDRLRKEAAAQRLLARLAAVAPEDSWALKGGIAMIALVGAHARATRDVDATWRRDVGALRETIDRAIECDLGDGFSFEIGAARDISGEGPERGLRFPVTARLAGREFERLRLDANIVPGDARGVVSLELPNSFDFAGLDPVTVPAVPPEQQLAEKIHAYTRDYGRHKNDRAKDLYDMLSIADHVALPTAGVIAASCAETFALRETAWPPVLRPPPESWGSTWTSFVDVHGTRFATLTDAYDALTNFWEPVVTDPSTTSNWRSDSWEWR